MGTARMTVLNCNPTGIYRVGGQSVMTDFATTEEAIAFFKGLKEAQEEAILAKTDPKSSGRTARRLLGYDEFAAPSIE